MAPKGDSNFLICPVLQCSHVLHSRAVMSCMRWGVALYNAVKHKIGIITERVRIKWSQNSTTFKRITDTELHVGLLLCTNSFALEFKVVWNLKVGYLNKKAKLSTHSKLQVKASRAIGTFVGHHSNCLRCKTTDKRDGAESRPRFHTPQSDLRSFSHHCWWFSLVTPASVVPWEGSWLRSDVCRGKHPELSLITLPVLELISGQGPLAALRAASATSHQMRPVTPDVLRGKCNAKPELDSADWNRMRFASAHLASMIANRNHGRATLFGGKCLFCSQGSGWMCHLYWDWTKQSHVICPKYLVTYTWYPSHPNGFAGVPATISCSYTLHNHCTKEKKREAA